MSHTFIVDNVNFIFNGDYSGMVKIIMSNNNIEIPCKAILEFVANYIRDKKIEKLEQMSSDEIFEI